MSLICGCLKWLQDHTEKKKKVCDDLLSGKITADQAADLFVPAKNGDGTANFPTSIYHMLQSFCLVVDSRMNSKLPEWIFGYDREKAIRDEALRLKVFRKYWEVTVLTLTFCIVIHAAKC